jgi:hypothetical protein
MITATTDPNNIPRIIYGYIVGSDILKKPFPDLQEENPEEFLEGCIQFFSDQDTEDGYRICADLLRMKPKLISETI